MSGPNGVVVRIDGLGMVYPGGVRALADVDLEVRDGEFLAILGLSGSGQSTLLRCVNRLIDPTEGRIWIFDEEVTALSGSSLRGLRRQVAMIFQQFNLVKRHTVISNVFSGALFVLSDYRWASVPSLRFNAYNMIPTTNDDIERIEFVLGPGSALYGPNVDKGVMHIITRSPLDHQGTTVSLAGGLRGPDDILEKNDGVFQGTVRHAGLFSENVGY